ncbi:MAG: BzdV protein, partial [Deltaproteobacteria bacterium]|nr:BzdV protein [Deltaproteobacteria bacterium]
RCLQCDLRLSMSSVTVPPEKYRLLIAGEVARIPDTEGVFQLLDEAHNILVIKGTMTLRQTLEEQLAKGTEARFFEFKEDKMYSKRESELLQQYLQKYGKMPISGGADELDDLF